MLYDGDEYYWKDDLERAFNGLNYYSAEETPKNQHKFYWRGDGRKHHRGILNPKVEALLKVDQSL